MVAIVTTPVSLPDLTTATVAGTGVFDVLMRAQKAHLEQEFSLARIKGTDYATVYLGSMEAVLQASVSFLLQKEKISLDAQLVAEQIELTKQQTLNAVAEHAVLVAQECKLRAEFDVLMETKLKTAEEKNVLLWKATTEKAQTVALGVDDNSVIGKQKALYGAQTDGFMRDAEQKAAKLMVDSWNVRRTTDSGVVADTTNKLDDASVGRAVTKLLTGVGA